MTAAAAATGSIGTPLTASAIHMAADAFCPTFLGLINIPCRRSDDHRKDRYNYEICHINRSLYICVYFALPLRAYSAWSPLSAFLTRQTTTATITATTIRPGTKPEPTPPVVMMVPI